MTAPAIRVEGLGKEYTLGVRERAGLTMREAIVESLGAPFRRLGRKASDERDAAYSFWALKDVSFEIAHGDVVGIIGRNGAGKSTLLKILSRITAPTTGRVEVRGRIASLLEVGTGFHPELTGRENIRLNGAILGMSSAEVRAKLDEIVDFAGVEKFIDTPVKRYSSGMQMRLAFAVAAHLEPEILVVDEVLAVGDAEFQKKCLGKMGEIAGRGGRTVLFVSHNMSAVQSLCRVGFLLDGGRLVAQGSVSSVLTEYIDARGTKGGFERQAVPNSDVVLTSANAVVALNDATSLCEIKLELVVKSKRLQTISIGVRVSDSIGTPVGYISVGALRRQDVISVTAGINKITLSVPAHEWAVGSYSFSVDLGVPDVTYLDRIENCISVEVDGIGSGGKDKSLSQSWGWGSLVLPPRNVSVSAEPVRKSSV